MSDVARHFGLAVDPFGPDSEAPGSAAFTRALDELGARLRNGARLVAVEGEPGTGRSRLLRLAAERLAEGRPVTRIGLTRHVDLNGRRLSFVDEAEALTPEALQRLIAQSSGKGGALIVALAPGQSATLREPVEPIRLALLTPAESCEYIADHLARAGAPANLFDPGAIATLAVAGGGEPRRTRRLAGLAMVEAMLDGASAVFAAHARAAIAADPQARPEPAPRATPAAERSSRRPATLRPGLPRRRQPLFALIAFAALLAIAALIWPPRARRAEPGPPAATIAAATPSSRSAPRSLQHAAPPARRDEAVTQPAMPPLETAEPAPVPDPAPPARPSAKSPTARRTDDRKPSPARAPTGKMPRDLLAQLPTPRATALAPATRAAEPVPARPRVLVHYWPWDADPAKDVSYALARRGWHILRLIPVNVRVMRASTRYFYAADAADARALAADLADELDEPVDPRNFTASATRPGRRTLEIWLPTGTRG